MKIDDPEFLNVYKSKLIYLKLHYIKIIRRHGYVCMIIFNKEGQEVQTLEFYLADRKCKEGQCFVKTNGEMWEFDTIYLAWDHYQKLLEELI